MYVGDHVFVSWDVLKLNPLKVPFEFTDLSTIGIHRIHDTVPLFVDLFDDDLGITKSQ
jgi:hypothetical protein